MNLKKLAQDALDVQNACNLSGVVHGWYQAIQNLREVLPRDQQHTDAFNNHPINRLWASKVHDLCHMGLSDTERFGEAWEACRRMAEAKE